jgi:hypothetical protein
MKRLLLILSILLVVLSSFQKNKKRKSQPALPVAIQQLIKQYADDTKANPPRTIYSYTYNNHTVYYVTAPCCDFFTDLYDSTGKLMGHPDGGFTGRGDGNFADFKEKKKNEKIIWTDKRK